MCHANVLVAQTFAAADLARRPCRRQISSRHQSSKTQPAVQSQSKPFQSSMATLRIYHQQSGLGYSLLHRSNPVDKGLSAQEQELIHQQVTHKSADLLCSVRRDEPVVCVQLYLELLNISCEKTKVLDLSQPVSTCRNFS